MKAKVEAASRRTIFLYYAVLGAISCHFALAYSIELPFYGADYRGLTEGFAQGRWVGPQQTRILMPIVFEAALGWRWLAHVSHRLNAPFNEPLNLLMLIVLALSIFIATEAVRRAARLEGAPESIARWGSLCVPLMAYFNYLLTPEIRLQNCYDLQQMAIFAICLVALLSRNRPVFYIAFLVGTLNKETTCFLIPMFGLLGWRRLEQTGRPAYGRVIAEMALMSALWIPVRYYATHYFTKNPVQMELFHWKQNLHFLLNPFHWPTMLSAFAFLWIIFLLQFKRIGHSGLQWCALLLPPWLLLMVMVGDLLEIRIYGEWTAYLALCTIFIVTDLLGLSREPLANIALERTYGKMAMQKQEALLS